MASVIRRRTMCSMTSLLFRPRSLSRRFFSDLPQTIRRPGPLALYKSMVEQGKLQHDLYQEKVASELQDLLGRLEQYEKDMEEYHRSLAIWENTRENERRKLLMDEAHKKQKNAVKENGMFDKWATRKRHEKAEPGVGKMVSYLNREKKLDSLVGRRPVSPKAPNGLYIYGSVGSGKTMLMDMFYAATEGIVKHRRRFHFHEAMLEIHEHMHDVWKNQVEEHSILSHIFNWISNLPFDTKVKEWLIGEERYKQESQSKHILPAVADKFLVDKKEDQAGARILCFDEIQTIDVFAVVALSGIVSRLLSTGTVLVATSNRAPDDLNQDGMQLEIFYKLVSQLEENCNKVLIGSEIDYRRLIPRKSSDQIHYFWPSDISNNKLEAIWSDVTTQSGGEIVPKTIPVMFGRKLEVPESCQGIAKFTFEYLCGRPIGAADYIAIAKTYHTIFITNIPVMSMRIRDKARRFITLVDELYNHHCCIYCSAATCIEDLFQGTDEGTLFDLESFQFESETEGGKLRRDVLAGGNVSSGGSSAAIVSLLSGQEEMFAFKRAVSRLIEMQTPLYLEGVQLFHPYFQRHSQAASVHL